MDLPMRPATAIFALFILLMIAPASGAPDEASGRVVQVIDGDTFDLNIIEHDGRIPEDTIRVRLADLDAPELYGERACEEGEWARDYTHSWLMDSIVSLDLDDLNGQDEYGRWIAVCYLDDGRNFNRIAPLMLSRRTAPPTSQNLSRRSMGRIQIQAFGDCWQSCWSLSSVQRRRNK